MLSRGRPEQRLQAQREPDFEQYKNLMGDLYLTQGKTRGEVSKILDEQYEFKATKYQYEKIFRTWGWTKNVPSHIWDKISPNLHLRKSRGEEFEVFYYSEKVQEKQVLRAMNSRPLALANGHLVMPISLPGGVAVLPLPVDKTPTLIQGLPFHHFEACLRADYLAELPIRPVTVAVGIDFVNSVTSYPSMHQVPKTTSPHHLPSAIAEAWYLNGRRIKPLEAVTFSGLLSRESPETSAISPGTQLYTSPLHRQILFSIANNFAGLGSFSIEQVIQFLQNKTSQTLYQMIRCAPGCYTTRAIAHNIFRAAVEIGDAQLFRFVLRHENIGINVNTFICSAEGRRCTPVERASGLQHREVVKALIDHRADVNLTDLKQEDIATGGALNYAVYVFADRTTYDRYAVPDFEMFAMLVEAGAEPSYFALTSLIEMRRDDLVRLLIKRHVVTNHKRWSRWGIFQHAVRCLDALVSMDIIEILEEVGADLNYHVQSPFGGTGPERIIDVAAQRGFTDVVKLLLCKEATLTNDTLPCAIASGNEELVDFLLQNGAKVDGIDRLGATPLSAAIRLGENGKKILDLLVKRQVLKSLEVRKHFALALRAASQIGDARIIEFLVQLSGEVKPEDLGHALIIAARDGQDEAAQTLIEAGADTNIISDSGPPLLEALKRRNARLVCALLNADADPNYAYQRATFSIRESAMMLAVKWGNRDVIQQLIDAGVNVNNYAPQTKCGPALAIAAGRGDLDLVKFLLHAGAEINNPRAWLTRHTALAAAVRNGKVEMARYLLDHGADPYDLDAISESAERHAELFDLLMDSHKARYSQGHKLFDATILKKEIETGNHISFARLVEKKLDATGLLGETSPFGDAIAKAEGGDLRFVEKLLQYGCSPQIIVMHERPRVSGLEPLPRVTAFLAAITTGSVSIVKLFIKHNADVNFPPYLGVKRTPLQRAAENEYLEIVQILIKAGADVNGAASERGGGTALQLAAKGGYSAIIKLLISYSASVDAPASKVDGRTALEGAAENGRTDVVAMLLNAGAASGGNDRAQLERAITFGNDNGHPYIGDMLKYYLAHRKLNSGLVSGGGHEPFGDIFDWNLWEGNASAVA